MRLVRLTCLVVFASVSLHNLLAHAAPRDEILMYQGPPDPDIAIHFYQNPSGWKGPRPGNPVTPKSGDVFFIIHDDDSSITLGTLDGYISPPFPGGDWLRDFARMPTERDPGAKQARDRILAGGAQTAAAREAERKAREREAGLGPTSQPSVDWKNRQYTLDCDTSPPIKVDVRNGHAERRPGNDYSRNGYIVDVEAVTRSQDLTGDGKPETAVLLYCSPQPSNFFVQEVQVFTDGSKLLTKLRSLDPLPTGNPLPPVFDRSEFTIRDGKLVTGVRYYAATDSHADGPSIHQVLTWHWNGQGFETEKSTEAAKPGKVLTFEGYKRIRIGLTIQEVSKVTGLKFSGAPPDKGSDCTYLTTPSLPGLWFMLISGTITRIDVDKGDYATPEGAKLGDTEGKIKRLYPKAEVEIHKYFPEGHYFTIRSPNKERAIVFETKDGKKVSTFRVGRPPEVEYVEGCG